jgi:hypothetical protein
MHRIPWTFSRARLNRKCHLQHYMPRRQVLRSLTQASSWTPGTKRLSSMAVSPFATLSKAFEVAFPLPSTCAHNFERRQLRGPSCPTPDVLHVSTHCPSCVSYRISTAAGLPSSYGRAVIPVNRLYSAMAPTLNQLHPSVAQVLFDSHLFARMWSERLMPAHACMMECHSLHLTHPNLVRLS